MMRGRSQPTDDDMGHVARKPDGRSFEDRIITMQQRQRYAILHRASARGTSRRWGPVLLLMLACLAGGRAYPAGNTYYVSGSGSDDNAGAQATPFRQIRKALTVVGPGDTILVADGTY